MISLVQGCLYQKKKPFDSLCICWCPCWTWLLLIFLTSEVFMWKEGIGFRKILNVVFFWQISTFNDPKPKPKNQKMSVNLCQSLSIVNLWDWDNFQYYISLPILTYWKLHFSESLYRMCVLCGLVERKVTKLLYHRWHWFFIWNK